MSVKSVNEAIGRACGKLATPEADRTLLTKCCIAGIGATIALGAVFGGIALMRKIDAHKRRSMYGPAWAINVPVGNGEWMRMLIAGNVCQSASYHGEKWNVLPFEYYRAFDRMFKLNADIRHVLMIGGGGFSYPKHLLTQRGNVTMDVLEPDSQIISMALDYFHLNRLLDECGDRIRILESTGESWLKNADRTYDAIVNDAFIGQDVVKELASPEYVQLAKQLLNPGGVYVANTVAYPSVGDYSHIEVLTESLRASFAYVQVIPSTDEEFSEEENYLVIASDTPFEFEDAIPV